MASRGTGEVDWNSTGTVDQPNWRLQTKQRAQTAAESSLSRGGFSAWTDVPPVGVHDPETAYDTRYGRQHFPGLPGKCREALPGAGGKRCLPEVRARERPEGKRIFDRSGDGIHEPPRPTGLKRVIPRGGIPPPATADPNLMYAGGNTKPRPEGVYTNREGRGQVKYQVCWSSAHAHMPCCHVHDANAHVHVLTVSLLCTCRLLAAYLLCAVLAQPNPNPNPKPNPNRMHNPSPSPNRNPNPNTLTP